MSNNKGPWGGGGGGNGRDDDNDDRRPARRPGQDGPNIPEIDEIMKKGQEQLKVLMVGRGGGGQTNGTGGGEGPGFSRGTIGLIALVAGGGPIDPAESGGARLRDCV